MQHTESIKAAETFSISIQQPGTNRHVGWFQSFESLPTTDRSKAFRCDSPHRAIALAKNIQEKHFSIYGYGMNAVALTNAD